MVLPQLLVAVDGMRKNPVQKSGFSHFEMKHRHGIQKISDRRCGNSITPKSKREKVFEYSQFLTGQKRISGST